MTRPFAHATAAVELDERRLRVVAEQAAGLRWQIVLTALVVAAVVWREVPTPIVALWFVAVIVIREWRMAALQRLVRDTATPIGSRLDALVRWNLLLGLSNGSAAFMMAWLDTSLDAVLTMILVSWGAGAVSTSSTVLRAFTAYAVWLFVPTAAMWLVTGTWLGAGVAALVLMFFGVQMRFARRNRETFEESFRIRLENEALARSLEQERTELARARDAAERASQEKSRFLAAASHDLRQPLQAITLNCGELLRTQRDGPAGSIAAEIGTSAEQLRSMLEGLLDLSKLDAGAVVAQPQRVRLDTLVAAVVSTFRAAATAKGLELVGRCPPALTVFADPDLLRRMLANLVDNALKFTPAGRCVVEAVPDAGEVELRVHDTGPGIAAEDQRLIFEDLVQLKPGGQRPAGHGLGLGIVRRAAALLGTSVSVDSSPGRGATFRWRLPRLDAEEAARGRVDAGWSLEGRHVMVVDDDAMVRGAYANALAGRGVRTSVAASIEEALEVQDPPEGAIVDWRLEGERDGLDALGPLRSRWPGLPVVMVTADGGDSLSEAARAQGVALLRKPVDVDTLGRALAAAIEARVAGTAQP